MEEIYLAGGQQVWRDSVRVRAYGDVDELNSTIGVVRAFNAELVGIHPSVDRLEEGLR
jgi:cob(I)alamin adenosyltransferase